MKILRTILAAISLLGCAIATADAKCDAVCQRKCDATWMNNSSLSSAQACYKKWSAINAKGHAYAHRIEVANMCDAQCRKKCDATWRRNPNLASAHACYEKWAIINQNPAEARRIEIRNTQNWNELDSAEKLRRQQRVKH